MVTSIPVGGGGGRIDAPKTSYELLIRVMRETSSTGLVFPGKDVVEAHKILHAFLIKVMRETSDFYYIPGRKRQYISSLFN